MPLPFLPGSQRLGNPRASLGQMGDAAWAERWGEAFPAAGLWCASSGQKQGGCEQCVTETPTGCSEHKAPGNPGTGLRPGGPGGQALGRVSCLFFPSGQVGLLCERTWEGSCRSLSSCSEDKSQREGTTFIAKHQPLRVAAPSLAWLPGGWRAEPFIGK